MMQLPKTSFFHHFNTRPKTYSNEEVRAIIEEKPRVKPEILTHGGKEGVKELSESSISYLKASVQSRV